MIIWKLSFKCCDKSAAQKTDSVFVRGLGQCYLPPVKNQFEAFALETTLRIICQQRKKRKKAHTQIGNKITRVAWVKHGLWCGLTPQTGFYWSIIVMLKFSQADWSPINHKLVSKHRLLSLLNIKPLSCVSNTNRWLVNVIPSWKLKTDSSVVWFHGTSLQTNVFGNKLWCDRFFPTERLTLTTKEVTYCVARATLNDAHGAVFRSAYLISQPADVGFVLP